MNGESFDTIRRAYVISKSTVARAIMGTATCRPWQKGQKGGGLTLLSPPDETHFKHLVKDMTDELNCISTPLSLPSELIYKTNV